MPQWNVKLARAVLKWINFTLKEQAVDQDNTSTDYFQEVLKSGILICRCMEAAGVTVNFKKNAKMPFHMMENIQIFTDKAREIGVPPESSFLTVDLYEGKDLSQVALGIRNVAKQLASRGFKVPQIEY